MLIDELSAAVALSDTVRLVTCANCSWCVQMPSGRRAEALRAPPTETRESPGDMCACAVARAHGAFHDTTSE